MAIWWNFEEIIYILEETDIQHWLERERRPFLGYECWENWAYWDSWKAAWSGKDNRKEIVSSRNIIMPAAYSKMSNHVSTIYKILLRGCYRDWFIIRTKLGKKLNQFGDRILHRTGRNICKAKRNRSNI